MRSLSKRYGLLVAIGILGAVALSAIPRTSRRPSLSATPTRASAITMRVEVSNDSVVAVPGSVAVGREVAMTVVNRSPRPIRLTLSGYEDRLSADLAPDSAWAVTFLADRPGEHMAWLVNDVPRGRLDVTGSHLVEGHR